VTENAAHETLHTIRAGADRALAWLIVAHFPVVLGVAAVHGTWWAALLVGAPLAAVPFWLARTKAGALVTRLTIAVAFMGMSALLIHQSHGMVELHFHIFAALAFLLIYRDWRVPVVAAAVIAVHHLVLNFDPEAHIAHLLPHGHYGLPIVVLHAIFVVFETAVLVFLSIALEREIVDLAEHRAREAAEREELSAQARRLAQRDLSVADEETDSDAAGIMREGISQVADLVRAISATATEVATSSRDVVTGAEEAGRVSGEIVAAVSDVAAGAERQAVLVADTHGAAERVAETLRGNAEEASAAAEAAEQARTLAGEGRTAAADASRAMAGAREGSDKMISSMSELTERSAEIAGLVSTITAIADQTNLLAPMPPSRPPARASTARASPSSPTRCASSPRSPAPPRAASPRRWRASTASPRRPPPPCARPPTAPPRAPAPSPTRARRSSGSTRPSPDSWSASAASPPPAVRSPRRPTPSAPRWTRRRA